MSSHVRWKIPEGKVVLVKDASGVLVWKKPTQVRVITASGNSSVKLGATTYQLASITIDGTEYKGGSGWTQEFVLPAGTEIVCKFATANENGSAVAYISVNGETKQSTNSTSGATYTYVVTRDATITLGTRPTSNQQNYGGTITIVDQ